MKDRRAYLASFMNHYDYPAEAVDTVLACYETLRNHGEANSLFEQSIGIYESDLMFDYKAQLEALMPIADICGAAKETVALVFVIALTEHLQKLYRQKSIPEEIFWNSMLDVKCKLMECKQVRGVWGTFVAHWYGRFFMMTRFGLGRLQFEPYFVPETLENEEMKLSKGQLVIKFHIPSSGPLKMEDCEASFQMAVLFYGHLFPEGEVIFYCESWLLAPEHKTLLNPESNIRKFMDFFTIFPTGKSAANNLWRIFGREVKPEDTQLPRDTSLRLIYADALARGECPTVGIGAFRRKRSV